MPSKSYNRATESVYRWYRIKQLETGLFLPDGNRLLDIEDVLPLGTTLVASGEGSVTSYNSGLICDERPYVYGSWFDPFTAQSLTHTRDTDFDLDTENGIVKFRDYRFNVNSSGYFIPASLSLMATFEALTSNLRIARDWVSVPYDTQNGTENAVYFRDDIYSVYGRHWNTSARVREELMRAAQARSNNRIALYQGTQEWTGIQVFPVQGNIHQMRWLVGPRIARTWGGKNVENPVHGPTWKERRVQEILSEDMPLC